MQSSFPLGFNDNINHVDNISEIVDFDVCVFFFSFGMLKT